VVCQFLQCHAAGELLRYYTIDYQNVTSHSGGFYKIKDIVMAEKSIIE
jgi:hypothetical protein